MKINKNINKLTANSIYYFKIDNLVECEKVLKELKMKNVDESRLYGYILERISMLILSNLPNFFTNYELCLIPKPKNKKLPLRLI